MLVLAAMVSHSYSSLAERLLRSERLKSEYNGKRVL